MRPLSLRKVVPFLIFITMFYYYLGSDSSKAKNLPEYRSNLNLIEVYANLKKVESSFRNWLANNVDEAVVPSVSAGIVVNDSIVLIDFINRRRAEAGDAGDRMKAIIGACKTRLRPILLTSITTIFGLMPLALGIFGREMWMTPMAISIVWGLSFSSVLTLLIIPCFYVMLEDVKMRLWGRKVLKTAAQASVNE